MKNRFIFLAIILQYLLLSSAICESRNYIQWYINDFISVVNHGEGSELLFRGEVLAAQKGALQFSTSSPVAFFSNSKFMGCIVMLKVEGGLQSHGLQIYEKKNNKWEEVSMLSMVQLPKDYKQMIEIGSVSENGSQALIRFGRVRYRDSKPRVMFEWETWSIDGKFVGSGLKL